MDTSSYSVFHGRVRTFPEKAVGFPNVCSGVSLHVMHVVLTCHVVRESYDKVQMFIQQHPAIQYV